MSNSARLADSSFGRSPLTASHTSRPKRKNGRGKAKLSESHEALWAGKMKEERMLSESGVERVWPSGAEPLHTHTSLTTHTPSHLTPDWFQQPVKLLNSIQLALSNPSEYPVLHTSSSPGHMTTASNPVLDSLTSHVTTPSSYVTNDFVALGEEKPPRRRSSSSSAPPLDDTGKQAVTY